MRSTRSFDATRTRVATLALVTLAAACGDQSAPIAPAPLDNRPQLAKGFTPAGPGSLPVRGRIAFSSGLAGSPGIFTANEDGTGLLRITYNGDADDNPVWSPDGRKIAFIKTIDDVAELYTVNRDGSGLRQLTALGKPFIAGLTWSPDSRHIAFSVALTPVFDEFDIYTVGAGGGGLTQLTSDPGVETRPAWSPDGARIAFTSNRTGTHQIFFMNADGSNPIVFPGCQTLCSDPAWSPDGTRLAYVHMQTIYVAPLGAPDQGTPIADNAMSPQWAPDGVKLVYTDGSQSTVFTINADGSNAQPLLVNTVAERYPSWGRK